MYLQNSYRFICFSLHARQHIIDETGDHFLVVEENEKSMTSTQILSSREQLLRTAHYMQGKGRYYRTSRRSEELEPVINVV